MAKPIHEQLAEARARAGLRQVDVAAAIGVQPAAVSLIESGQRNTTTDRLERWAEACGAHVVIASTPSDGAAALLSSMGPDDAELALRLVTLLPDLSGDHRFTLEALIGAWALQGKDTDL